MLAPPGLLEALHYTEDDREKLAAALLRSKLEVYTATLRGLLVQAGREDVPVRIGSQVEAALRAEAEDHATIIVATYNRELDEFVAGLPQLDTGRLLLMIEEWTIRRGDGKAPIIAVTEAYAAHADATVALFRDNNMAIDFDFGGHGDDPPDCDICKALAAGNPWTIEQVISIGVPHIGCRQEWHPRDFELPEFVAVGLQVAGIVGGDTLLHRAGNRAAAVDLIERMT